MITELQASKHPVVNVSAIDLPDATFPSVTSDYDACAQIAVEHFVNQGFRRFAYSGPEQFSYAKKHREAFTHVCQQVGGDCNVQPRRKRHTGDQAMALRMADNVAWLKSLTKPVAVFTWSTDEGREILEACRAAGLSAPYEVAVLAGDNDDLLCDAATPKLSGTLLPCEQIGHTAAQMLNDLMHRRKLKEKSVRLPPTGIAERPSTETLAIEDTDVVQSLEFIRENACSAIQIADVLRAVPVSRRTLERKFSEILGRTPSEEIRRIRLAKVRNLLAETDMSMQAIAGACGYGTYNYLTRVFSSEFSMTPREYRKRTQAR